MNVRDFMDLYSPDKIPGIVNCGMESIYFGHAPTLRSVKDCYGENLYHRWFGAMFGMVISFAGLASRFDWKQVEMISELVLSRYPALKVTEFMHFVYLWECGEYEGFYGNPSGRAFMSQLALYVNRDKEAYMAKLRKSMVESVEDEVRGLIREEELTAVGQVIDRLVKSSEFADAGAWRDEPWAAMLAYAHYRSKALDTFPGDMNYVQRKQWAEDHGFKKIMGL